MTDTNIDKEIDVTAMEDSDIHAELKSHGINLHHKTGSAKLQETLTAVLNNTYETAAESQDIETVVDNVKHLTTAEHIEKLTPTQRAMRMQRVIVSPNDPLMSTYNGLIFTVGASKVNKGRMVKKYVPFNNDNGWHVPQIIIDQIEAAQMQKFKQVNLPNGEKTLQAYITKKFNVQILPPLSQAEMGILAASQVARSA
jgi:hypothetical protein